MQKQSIGSLKKTSTNKKSEIAGFMRKYNPDYIITHCKGLTIEDISTLCIFSESPTLSELKAFYGDNTPIAWLIPQLFTLSEFCGARDKMTEDVAERTAFIIYTHFYYLKVSELLLFFFKFSTGKYGHFYGMVDPQVIINAISAFVSNERNPMIERKENEERLKRRQQECKHAISYSEYLKTLKQEQHEYEIP